MSRSRAGRRPRARRGIGLIEMMVAIVILGIAATGLAAMSFWASRRAVVTNLRNQQYATEVRLVDQLTVMPFDSLRNRIGCRTSDDATFRHSWCIDVTDVTPRHRRLTLIVQPVSPLLRPDTVQLERTKATPYIPLS